LIFHQLNIGGLYFYYQAIFLYVLETIIHYISSNCYYSKPEKYKDVPFIEEILKEEKHKTFVNLLRGIQLVGRPFAGPPDIPADRLKVLRDAFEKACKDPEALAFAKRANRPMDFVGYQEVEKWAKGHFELPHSVIAKIKEAYGVK